MAVDTSQLNICVTRVSENFSHVKFTHSLPLKETRAPLTQEVTPPHSLSHHIKHISHWLWIWLWMRQAHGALIQLWEVVRAWSNCWNHRKRRRSWIVKKVFNFKSLFDQLIIHLTTQPEKQRHFFIYLCSDMSWTSVSAKILSPKEIMFTLYCNAIHNVWWLQLVYAERLTINNVAGNRIIKAIRYLIQYFIVINVTV